MTSEKQQQVVLVVGACGLDRLLTVQSYPIADAKVRTKAYHEVGGGNAANSASAMALISTAAMFQKHNNNIRIKLLTKIGMDDIGRQLSQELREAGVDLSSPLFCKAGTTTAFTTVIVSEDENTRTCLHTPGTCGNLTAEDVASTNMDQVFENVVHLHSDIRHTEASLLLAREAQKRNIPVSVDAEKDRHSPYMDELLEIATFVFTNSSQLDDYIERRTLEMESDTEREPLPKQVVQVEGRCIENPQVYADSTLPSQFFNRSYGQSQMNKQVIITKGSIGALHVQCKSWESTEKKSSDIFNHIAHNSTALSRSNRSSVINAQHCLRETKAGRVEMISNSHYEIRSVGVLREASVVDTTGAGDAFIGGYLMSLLLENETKDRIKFGLEFGAWVAGMKLSGPGARSALPRGSHVDQVLGESVKDASENLNRLLYGFQESP